MLEMLLRRSGARRERWLSENSHGGKICTTYAGCESKSELESTLFYFTETSTFILCYIYYVFMFFFYRQVKM